MPSYAVIEGTKLIGTAPHDLALARRHRDGIAGRRIIELDAEGERIPLKDRRNVTFYIRGREVE